MDGGSHTGTDGGIGRGSVEGVDEVGRLIEPERHGFRMLRLGIAHPVVGLDTQLVKPAERCSGMDDSVDMTVSKPVTDQLVCSVAWVDRETE